MSNAEYHLRELKIAQGTDEQRNLPLVPKGVERILDVGCGAGQTLIALGVTGTHAVGVDYDLEALRLGQSLTARIDLLQSSGEQLPFRDEIFDFAYSRVALPYMDIGRAVREIARVLRPGGGVWLSLHPLSMLSWKSAFRSPKTLAFEVYRLVNTAAFTLSGRLFRYPLKRSRLESYQTERGMRLVLAAAGFGEIRFAHGHHFVVTARKRG